MTDPPRFALLEHRWNGVHWDFLLERGPTLRTWAIDAPIRPNASLPARSLPDHRLAYLDYEGPVSGDRGEVRRVAGGSYDVVVWEEDRVLVRVRSDQLRGSIALSRRAGGAWDFLFAPGNVD